MAGTIGIQESFNNVKIVCDNSREPGLTNAERQAVNESLDNIVKALQDGIAMKAKIELLEKQIVEEKKDEETVKDE